MPDRTPLGKPGEAITAQNLKTLLLLLAALTTGRDLLRQVIYLLLQPALSALAHRHPAALDWVR